VLNWLLLVVFEERTIFLDFSWRGGAQYCNAVAVAVAVAVPAVAAFPQVRGGAPTTLIAVPFVAFRLRLLGQRTLELDVFKTKLELAQQRHSPQFLLLHSVLRKYVACFARL
jgi:hypothetical protein